MARPKDELISQKSGHRATSIFQSHRYALFFDVKYPLTGKNSPPILPAVENNVLSIPKDAEEAVCYQCCPRTNH
jgi:hypothetical protein